jgi:hypothetical protein
MEEEEMGFGSRVGLFFVTILLLIPVLIFEGTVMRLFWDWFVVSNFGIPKITLPVAIGFILITQFFKNLFKSSKKITWGRAFDDFFTQIFFAGFLLLLGWIIHLFV